MSTELRISDDISIMFMSYYLGDAKNFTHTMFRLRKIYNSNSFPIGLKVKEKYAYKI